MTLFFKLNKSLKGRNFLTRDEIKERSQIELKNNLKDTRDKHLRLNTHILAYYKFSLNFSSNLIRSSGNISHFIAFF